METKDGTYHSHSCRTWVFLPKLGKLPPAAMDIASKIPVVEGGPAGSGVFEATISTPPERHGGAALGSILIKNSAKISLRIPASSTQP
jgi:hypothetical protein